MHKMNRLSAELKTGFLFIVRKGSIAKNYFKKTIENDWNYLIGSNRTDYYSQCWEEFQCNWDDYLNGGTMQRATPDFTECPTVMVCSSQPVRINEPSDGFIDAFSQRGGLYLHEPSHTERALGVNHNEEQTDIEVRGIIERAFDGQYGTFFRTDPRN